VPFLYDSGIGKDEIRLTWMYSIPFVLTPLTIATVSLRSCSSSTATIIGTLSTCYSVLQVFVERYEIVDYYLQLNEMCAALTHEWLMRQTRTYTPDWSLTLRTHSRGSAQLYIPLPPSEIYSSVLQTLEKSIIRGVPDPLRLRQSPSAATTATESLRK
jgi:hypothetical protein